MEITKLIKEIADEQYAKEEPISRADLAWILSSQTKGGYVDEFSLNDLIYEAYKQYGRPASIREAILTNQGNQSVVDQYELPMALDNGASQEVRSLVQKDLKQTDLSLDTARQSVANVLKLELIESAASIAQMMKGTDGIEKVRSKASALMQNYGKMVSDYQTAETSVKTDIHDFLQLRADVNALFMQYATALVDVFGESIKVVEPSLFNFDDVKWLDVNMMQTQTRLEYDKLDEKCILLLGEIAQHFESTINTLPAWMKMSKSLGKQSGLYGSLVVGALSFINHRMDAQVKTTKMEREYVSFEDSVKRDRHQINGDMLRLATIHKVLNDLYIPRAYAFDRLANQVLSDDLQQLLNSLYTDKSLELKSRRDQLLEECKTLERSIHDHQENITYYEAKLANDQGLIASQKANYMKAVAEKPSSPNIALRLLSLGYLQQKYEDNLLVWNDANGSFVEAYEEALTDVKEGLSDLETHKKQLFEDQQQYDKCRKEITALNQQMAQALQCSPERKMQVLKHLKGMISLLRSAKSVTESKLDERLMNTTTVPTLEDYVKLPANVEANIDQFIKEVQQEVAKTGATIASEVMNEFEVEKGSETAVNVEQSVKSAALLLDSWTRLQKKELRSQLTDAVYELEMQKLKNSFKEEMQKLDNQSAALSEVLKVANTTTDKEELRKALMDMTGMQEYQLSEADFDALLRGEKQIEI